MRVALVYDRVNKFGGAERVIKAIHQIFPDAPLFTLVHDPAGSVWAKDIKIIPSFINAISFLRKRHELLAPISGFAFETFDFSEYDLVISITSESAKSIITSTKTLHICYCLTPNRYFWCNSLADIYGDNWKMKIVPKFLLNYLKRYDLMSSARPDYFLSISQEISKRIKTAYNRQSEVIYPSIEDLFFKSKIVPLSQRKYYLAVGRLVPYKKFDLVVQAFNKLGNKLVVVGDGSELSKLKQCANKNIIFKTNVSDKELANLYSHARAVIFPQIEDFGLVPLESQAAGTPVIAYGQGGATETIINGKTGILFKNQTLNCLLSTIGNFEQVRMNILPSNCRSQARKFSKSRFLKEFSAKVIKLWETHQSTSM